MPDEWTFSRAFAEFSASRLPERVHEALVRESYQTELVGHLSRDSTAIEAREKPAQKAATEKPKAKRGRPVRGEVRAKPPLTRIERQAAGMGLAEMLDDLPKPCDVGTKKNSKGYKESWTGYKLHLDVADGGVPVSAVLTSASTHDSQAAIPLAALSAGRVVNLYDVMDAAYDVPQIREASRKLGHVPLVDVNPRRDAAGRGAENRACGRGRAAQVAWPHHGGGGALPRAEHGRAGQRAAEGRIRRALRQGQGERQGDVPPDVRGVGPDRRPVAAVCHLACPAWAVDSVNFAVATGLPRPKFGKMGPCWRVTTIAAGFP